MARPDVASGIRPVEYALNTTATPTLGVSPIECHTGIQPRNALRLMTVHGARLKSVDKRTPKVEMVAKHLEKIRRVFKEMHEYVKRKKVSSRQRNWRSQKRTADPNIHVGDFVMAERPFEKEASSTSTGSARTKLRARKALSSSPHPPAREQQEEGRAHQASQAILRSRERRARRADQRCSRQGRRMGRFQDRLLETQEKLRVR